MLVYPVYVISEFGPELLDQFASASRTMNYAKATEGAALTAG